MNVSGRPYLLLLLSCYRIENCVAKQRVDLAPLEYGTIWISEKQPVNRSCADGVGIQAIQVDHALITIVECNFKKNYFIGCYYLVDAGYTNCEGFLAPFRGQRYHLNEWRQGYQPSSPQEFFNMKHASARNVIERCFGLLKLRWGILRSPSFYPVRVHNRIIIACCLLHNFIRTHMSIDPIEAEVGEGLPSNVVDDDEPNIVNIHPSDAWATWRMELANQMFDEWQASRN